MATSIEQQVSWPMVSYTDPDGAAVSYNLPAPRKFKVRPLHKKSVNEANSGVTEVLSFFSRDEIELSWEFLGIGYGPGVGPVGEPKEMAALRRLWEDCRDGRSITLKRHYAIAGHYPDPDNEGTRIHDNTWTVMLHRDMTEFTIENAEDVKDRFNVTLKFEEVIS